MDQGRTSKHRPRPREERKADKLLRHERGEVLVEAARGRRALQQKQTAEPDDLPAAAAAAHFAGEARPTLRPSVPPPAYANPPAPFANRTTSDTNERGALTLASVGC